MKNVRAAGPLVVLFALGTLVAAGCGAKPTTGASQAASLPSVAGSPQAVGAEQPVKAEQNPAGDIPDSQAFVPFQSSAGGYTVDAPEGWARTTTADGVTFSDKLDGERIQVAQATAAPTAANARDSFVATLMKSGRAVQVSKVQDVQLPAGSAVLVAYSSNSEPDAVTGKQVRQENEAYLLFSNGKLATLTLWAPLGADNVDQWQRIVHSFRWV